MRGRPDAWQLIFDRLYVNSSATFKTAPNALLVDAVEGDPQKVRLVRLVAQRAP